MTTAATLILELSLTRIFSVVFYYHFAFLAISVALFGLGAGGVLSYYLALRGQALFRRLGWLSLLNAVAVVLTLALVLKPAGGASGFVHLGTVYLAAALPFVLAGMVVSMALAETIERVERVYLFDLLGASAGCLLVIPFLNMVGGPGTVLAAAVLFAAAGAVWFGLARAATGRAVGVGLALVLVALILVNKRASILDVRSAKGEALEAETFVEWNSFSRISLAKAKPGTNPLIVIDADATTGIPGFDLDHLTPAERAELIAHGPGFPYRLRPGAKTLVIGAGGGWECGPGDRLGLERRGRCRDQPHHCRYDHAAALPGAQPRPLSPPRDAHCRRRRAQLRAPQQREIPAHPGHPGGHLGVDRGGRFRAV